MFALEAVVAMFGLVPPSTTFQTRASGRTRKGPKWLGIALQEGALAANPRQRQLRLGALQATTPRLGHGRALGAVKHSMITAYWHMFTTGEIYTDPGGDYFDRRDPERLARRLIARLNDLGHTVTLNTATTTATAP